MSRAEARFRQADIRRAVKGAQDAGIEVKGVEISRDGTIKIQLTGGGGSTVDSAAAATAAWNEWKGSQK